jgi:S1-C subfamily serine protease
MGTVNSVRAGRVGQANRRSCKASTASARFPMPYEAEPPSTGLRSPTINPHHTARRVAACNHASPSPAHSVGQRKRRCIAIPAHWLAALAALCFVATSITYSTSARGQDNGTKPPNRDGGEPASATPMSVVAVIRKVNPAIAEVRAGHVLGCGVVIDAAKALVATNLHILSRASKVALLFPSDKTDKEYPVDGFLVALPGRDLVILHVQAGDKKLTALPLASKLPERGETVYGFGTAGNVRPRLMGTIAKGTVTSIRAGRELADLFDRNRGKGHSRTHLPYDPDSVWIQHCVPTSHDSAGGPLVNERAEVVGLNMLCFDFTDAERKMNFALSAKHVKGALGEVNGAVKPLTKLPKMPAADAPDGGRVDNGEQSEKSERTD